MSITDDEDVKLQEILQDCNDNFEKLNGWEQGFISDNQQRYEEYGAGIRLSAKQWKILYACQEKAVN
tara:strand:+ start:7384 stop:7584 length:201 start_codon:yes stop_codon:yes gene_type:complete